MTEQPTSYNAPALKHSVTTREQQLSQLVEVQAQNANAIARLTESIEQLRVSMEQRFDDIDANLDAIGKGLIAVLEIIKPELSSLKREKQS